MRRLTTLRNISATQGAAGGGGQPPAMPTANTTPVAYQGSVTVYIGNWFEWDVETGTGTNYYYAGAQRIAMRKEGQVYYLLGDHLGSTSVITNESGTVLSETRYTAWGEVRYNGGWR